MVGFFKTILSCVNINFVCLKQMLCFGKRVDFKKGDYFVRQGDTSETIFFLMVGRIKIVTVTPDGKEIILWYTLSSNIINEVNFYHQLPSNASIIAVEYCETISFDTKAIHNLTSTNPQFSEALLVSMAKKIRILDQRRTFILILHITI